MNKKDDAAPNGESKYQKAVAEFVQAIKTLQDEGKLSGQDAKEVALALWQEK